MIPDIAVIFLAFGVVLGFLAAYPYLYYLYHLHTFVPEYFDTTPEFYPHISVVVNAYKEGDLVKTRVHDIWRSAYPPDNISVYVVNDGADPATSRAAHAVLAEHCTEIFLREPSNRLGKTACQNAVLSEIQDEIVVFTDADITTRPDALKKLVARLSDPEVGAVCADLVPVGSNVSVTESEGAYRSIYGKMCEYDSSLDSTYNFNGPLIAFKKSAVSHIPASSGADDANLALTCISHGYRAVYASEAVAYELQPTSFRSQYRQKIRRADGLIHSTRLFQHTSNVPRAKFWNVVFPMRKWMLLYSPVLFLCVAVLFGAGMYWWSFLFGTVYLAVGSFICAVSLLRPNHLFSSFVLNQFYLVVGLLKKQNVLLWERVEK